LRYVPVGELRPLRAIETTEAWLRGDATLEQVRAARDATYAATYAAATAAASAYYAAEAATAADYATAAAYAAAAAYYAAYAAAADADDYAFAAAAAADYAAAHAAGYADRTQALRDMAVLVREHVEMPRLTGEVMSDRKFSAPRRGTKDGV
jgi:hypothetical protein